MDAMVTSRVHGMSFLTLQLLEIWIFSLALTGRPVDGAACSSAQMTTCTKAVNTGKLSSLASAGRCQARTYVEFTHLCLVNNYLPSVDHCCCALEDRIFCCRFHNSWNRFHCSEDKDVIGAVTKPVSLHIILPAVLGSVLLIVIITVFCVCFKRRKAKKNKQVTHEQQQPLANPIYSDSQKPSSSSPRHQFQLSCQSEPPLPSAPVLEDMDNNDINLNMDPSQTAYYRSHSEPPAPFNVGSSECSHSHMMAGRTARQAQCPSCASSEAPPTYEESRDHLVLS